MGICESNGNKQGKSYYEMTRTLTQKPQDNQISSNIQNNPNIQNNAKNQIKLEFTLENCIIGNQYYVKTEFLNTSDSFETEHVFCHNRIIAFNSTYLCEYLFQIPQLMRITVYKNNKNMGSFTPYLGLIVGSPNSTFTSNISPDNPELIIITAQSISGCENLLMVNFIVRANKNVDFNDTKNKISFMITSNDRKIYTSESISQYGQFKNKSIPKVLLEPQFEVTFFNYKNEKILSKIENPNNFTQQNNQVYLTLSINNNDYYIYNNSQLSQQYSFIDYIKNGVQIALSIGIDFTRSNGEVNNPNSLHRIIPGYLNDYEQAIKSCGLIMAFYDYDQLFPVYGFGAIIDNNSQNASMCFNINFQQNPEIHTIDNVINEYHNCLGKIFLYGPTEFSPIIKKEIEIINRENNPLNYHVLMILTDGVIDDFDKTVDTIIEASFLPFSLIIIGIGNANFDKMVELDGDNVPLVSSNGVKRLRDVVQFVPFNKYRNNNDELTNQVLEEIPTQIVEYYSMNKIYPNDLKSGLSTDNNIKNIYTINYN